MPIIQVEVTEETRRSLKAHAARTGSTMRDVAAQVIADFVRQVSGKVSETPQPGAPIVAPLEEQPPAAPMQGVSWDD